MPPCVACKEKGEKHLLFMCPKYKALPLNQRWIFVKKTKRCYNCLSDKHDKKDCPSLKYCRLCEPKKEKHHTTLCLKGPEGPLPEYKPKLNSNGGPAASAHAARPGKYVQQSRKKKPFHKKKVDANALFEELINGTYISDSEPLSDVEN